MTDEEILVKLRAFIGKRTYSKASKELKISRGYLRDIMLGRRAAACPAILRRFGLRKRVIIEKKPLTKDGSPL